MLLVSFDRCQTDTPANRKLSRWLSCTAANGCGYCALRATSGQELGLKGGMYFLGYTEPTAVNKWRNLTNLFEPMPETALCGDPDIRITSEMQKARANFVSDYPAASHDVGCHGWALFVRELPYLEYNDMWVLPVAHAALLGVCKRFWQEVLGPLGADKEDYAISSPHRKIMSARAEDIVMTNDMNRPYRDIC